jgi:hypothetical protein
MKIFGEELKVTLPFLKQNIGVVLKEKKQYYKEQVKRIKSDMSYFEKSSDSEYKKKGEL